MENQQTPNNPAPEPVAQPTQQPTVVNPSGTPQQPQAFSPGPQTVTGTGGVITGQLQPNGPAHSRKKPLLIGILIVLLLAGGGAAAMKLVNKKTPSVNNNPSNQTTSSVTQWVEYNDPTLGFKFSYPKAWHIFDSKDTKEPSGRTIYIGPNAINTDSESLKQQHLDDPELAFYVYNTNPTGSLDNQPITAPDKKLGTLNLANGKTVALIESKFTSYDDSVTLSACSDASCVFKIGSKFMSPSIKPLGSAAGVDGHDIDKSSSTYQTELKIWQSVNY